MVKKSSKKTKETENKVDEEKKSKIPINHKKLSILLGIYITALAASNLIGGKLMPIGFGNRGLSVSIIIFPLLFLITDIVGEVYGKRKAKEFVNIGLMSLIILLLWQLFAISVPGAIPNPFFETFNPAYQTVFGLSISFTIASIIAFIIGQRVDVLVFHFLKKLHGNRLIWLRNNLSTFTAQFIDSSIWALIAFSPMIYSGSTSILGLYSTLIIPYWLAKCIVAVIDTPLIYAGVKWLKS